MANKRRWGRLTEIRKVDGVDSKAFAKLPSRLQHLTAWREMHAMRSHTAVSASGRRIGFKPSSDMPVAAKVAFIHKRQRMNRTINRKALSKLRLPS